MRLTGVFFSIGMKSPNCGMRPISAMTRDSGPITSGGLNTLLSM